MDTRYNQNALKGFPLDGSHYGICYSEGTDFSCIGAVK